MSRELPPHPNLTHLKKQAKTLLSELRARSPASKLADAQRELAGRYGFRSWTSLKTHVETQALAAGFARPRAMVGTWTTNAADADGATIEVDVVDEAVTITDIVVDALGREQRFANELRADGNEHAAAHGYSVVSVWVGSDVLETLVKKAGRPVSRVTYRVSADGKALDVSAIADAHDGYPAVLRSTLFQRAEHRLEEPT